VVEIWPEPPSPRKPNRYFEVSVHKAVRSAYLHLRQTAAKFSGEVVAKFAKLLPAGIDESPITVARLSFADAVDETGNY
jgi:hypothetical protein